MKISEQFIADDHPNKFHIKKVFDATPQLEQVKALKSAGAMGQGENRLVARVPLWLINEWCKEAGVLWTDVEARREVMHKKLLSGDVSAFRVWEGSY
jgi:hypothetical protein